MQIDPAKLEQAVMAVVEVNGCGCTVGGKHVPCDHPEARDSIGRGPHDCDCRKAAEAVIRVLRAIG